MGDDLRSVFSDNLKKYMKEAGKTQADIMEYMGCSSSTVSDWCNGKKYPRPERMQRLADLFGIKMSDLTAQHSLPTDAYGIDLSRMSVIPILGKISAGLPIFADENIEGYTITDLNGGADYFALRVSGDSMNAIQRQYNQFSLIYQQKSGIYCTPRVRHSKRQSPCEPSTQLRSQGVFFISKKKKMPFCLI